MVSPTSPSYVAATRDFRQARRRAALRSILRRLTGKSSELLSFEEVRGQLKASGSAPPELREIPLDHIVGSVGRYADFTRDFLPLNPHDEERWARVMALTTSMEGLPPIQVFQIGEAYFVLDGNHRVSTARQLGASHIHAYVTPIHTRVPLAPDDEPDDLILKAEYAEFLECTHLDELRPGADLRLTAPGGYARLAEHIAAHRYFMGLERQRDTPFEQAAVHWYDTVYLPAAHLIRQRGILRDFPGRTEADLCLWLSDHRAALAEHLGWEVEPERAAADLAAQHGQRGGSVGERLMEAILPAELEPGPPPGQWRRGVQAGRSGDYLFEEILVAISGEQMGWRALDQALQVARLEGAQLRGLHVLAGDEPPQGDFARAVQAEFGRRCEAAGVPGRLVLATGKVARTIADRARGADLVVVSLSYPPGPAPLGRLGSGFRALIQRCPRPLLATPGAATPLQRTLLAYDGSPKGDEALYIAAALAGKWGAALTVITVAEETVDEPRALEHAWAYLSDHGVQAAYIRASGPVGEAVLHAAREHSSDLIVMGGYGFHPVLEVALGSAVDQVLRESRAPTLICR